MKKNNGFTLVELLAVITILGVIMIVGGVAAVNIKKDANIKEAKQIEEMLKDLGPGIYSYEKSAGVYDARSYCKKIESEDYISGLSCKNGASVQKDKYFYPKYSSAYNNTELFISFSELYQAGYLKEVVLEGSVFKGIKNPSGGEPCNGYLKITKTDDGPVFNSCLYCPGIDGYTTDDCIVTDSVKLTK